MRHCLRHFDGIFAISSFITITNKGPQQTLQALVNCSVCVASQEVHSFVKSVIDIKAPLAEHGDGI